MIPRVVWRIAVAAMLVPLPAAAQLSSNLGGLTAENAQSYLGPLPKALSGMMNSAIFKSGSVPKVGVTFEVGARAMGVNFSSDDRLYTPKDPPGFSSSGTTRVPTVIGDENAKAVSGSGGSTLYYPGGFNIDNFAIAVPQLTIGSVAGTSVTARWIAVKIGNSDFGDLKLFGIGAQHSISRYLPALPVNLSAGIFYQTFQLGDDDLIDTKALQFAVTASKAFGIAEPYLTVGYDSFHMEVNYTSDTASPGEQLNIEFDSQNDAHFTGGVMVGLPVVKFFAEVNVAAQTGAALGLRFGI